MSTLKDSKDEKEIYEAYHQLFEASLNIKMVNKVVLKKVNTLELKRETLIYELYESTKSLSELILINENLKAKVTTLTSDLEKSNTQLYSFLSEFQKLDNL